MMLHSWSVFMKFISVVSYVMIGGDLCLSYDVGVKKWVSFFLSFMEVWTQGDTYKVSDDQRASR